MISFVIIGTIYTSIKSNATKTTETSRKTHIKRSLFTQIMDTIIKSFSLQEGHKKLFTPLNDRLLIAEALLLFYLAWLSIVYNYIIIISSGLVGYKNFVNSFTLNILTESEYFWLRTLFPRDMVGLLTYVDNVASLYTIIITNMIII